MLSSVTTEAIGQWNLLDVHNELRKRNFYFKLFLFSVTIFIVGFLLFLLDEPNATLCTCYAAIILRILTDSSQSVHGFVVISIDDYHCEEHTKKCKHSHAAQCFLYGLFAMMKTARSKPRDTQNSQRSQQEYSLELNKPFSPTLKSTAS